MKVFGLLHTDSLFNWCKQGHKDNSFSKIFFFEGSFFFSCLSRRWKSGLHFKRLTLFCLVLFGGGGGGWY